MQIRRFKDIKMDDTVELYSMVIKKARRLVGFLLSKKFEVVSGVVFGFC